MLNNTAICIQLNSLIESLCERSFGRGWSSAIKPTSYGQGDFIHVALVMYTSLWLLSPLIFAPVANSFHCAFGGCCWETLLMFSPGPAIYGRCVLLFVCIASVVNKRDLYLLRAVVWGPPSTGISNSNTQRAARLCINNPGKQQKRYSSLKNQCPLIAR